MPDPTPPGDQDEILATRRRLLAQLPRAFRQGASGRRLRQAGQRSLFEDVPADEVGGELEADPEDPAWTDAYLIAAERKSLGCYLALDPLGQYAATIRAFSSGTPAAFLASAAHGDRATIGGAVRNLESKTVKAKHGKAASRMIRFALDGLDGAVSCILWQDAAGSLGVPLVEGFLGFLGGKCSRRREEPDLIVDSAVPMAEARARLALGYLVWTRDDSAFHAIRMSQFAEEFPGHLRLYRRYPDGRVFRLGRAFRVRQDPALVEAMTGTWGTGRVALVGPGGVVAVDLPIPPG
jgi:DNA polymerase III alpha subunit